MMNNCGSLGKEILGTILLIGFMAVVIVSLIFAVHVSESNVDVITTHFSLVESSDGVVFIDDGIIKQELSSYEVGDADCLSYTVNSETGKVKDVTIILCQNTIDKLKDDIVEIVRSNSWLRGVDPVPNNV
jgi:hypothetical protein